MKTQYLLATFGHNGEARRVGDGLVVLGPHKLRTFGHLGALKDHGDHSIIINVDNNLMSAWKRKTLCSDSVCMCVCVCSLKVLLTRAGLGQDWTQHGTWLSNTSQVLSTQSEGVGGTSLQTADLPHTHRRRGALTHTSQPSLGPHSTSRSREDEGFL